MKANHIITASAIMLFLAGIAHLIRIFYNWNVTISTWEIPVWVSFIAAGISLFLAKSLLKQRK